MLALIAQTSQVPQGMVTQRPFTRMHTYRVIFVFRRITWRERGLMEAITLRWWWRWWLILIHWNIHLIHTIYIAMMSLK
jgi:hypothetical protein